MPKTKITLIKASVLGEILVRFWEGKLDAREPGEWLLSSYIATGIENVLIFIRADNAENELEKFLSQTLS